MSKKKNIGSILSAFEIVEIRFRPVEKVLLPRTQPVREAPCELEKRVERRLLDVERRKN